MQNITFTPPNPEQRRTILEEYGFKFDRRIREDECSEITSLSRSSSWKMEQEEHFPPELPFWPQQLCLTFVRCALVGS